MSNFSYLLFQCINDYREVIKRIRNLEELIDRVLTGQNPSITFKFNPSLTKPLTLSLYKWVLLSHLYLHHRAIQKFLETHEDITNEDVAKLIEELESEKKKRRYECS